MRKKDNHGNKPRHTTVGQVERQTKAGAFLMGKQK